MWLLLDCRYAGIRWAGVFALVGLVSVFPADASQSILKNGSMEAGQGAGAPDPMIPADWTLEGNVVERSAEANLVPAGEGHALKAFQSNPTERAFQEVDVVAGDSVTASAMLFTRSQDKLGGDAQAGIRLLFFDQFEIQVGSTSSAFVLNSASPSDTWIPASIGPVIAPANATSARIECIWVSDAGAGSAFWDDVQVTVNGGPNALLNGDFEVAGIGDQSPTGIDEWQGFNDQEQSEDFALHGIKSLKIGTTDPFSGLFQTIDDFVVSEGDHLLLKARVFQPSVGGLGGTARAGIKLEFSATSGGALPPPTENLAFNENTPTNSWMQVDVSTSGLVVPDGATLARITLIYFVPDMSVGDGAAYFDAAHAEVASNPGVNLLLNPGFTSGAGVPDNWTVFESPPDSFAVRSTFEVPDFDTGQVTQGTAKAFGTKGAGFFQEVPVVAGDVLSAHVQMYNNQVNKLTGTAVAGIKVEWIGGSVPGQVDITPGESDNTILATSPKDTWIPLEIDFVMPAGTEALPRFVAIVAKGTTGTGAAYFDNCELVVLNTFDGSDSDGDGDEDLADFWEFQRCFGPGLDFNCTIFDSDDSGNIDLLDYDFFAPRLTGP